MLGVQLLDPLAADIVGVVLDVDEETLFVLDFRWRRGGGVARAAASFFDSGT